MSQELARHHSSHQLSELLKVIYVTLNQVPVKTWEDPSDNQWRSQQDPAWFPHNSPAGLVNSPPGATVPKETEQQTTSSHESPWGFQWEMDVYTQL